MKKISFVPLATHSQSPDIWDELAMLRFFPVWTTTQLTSGEKQIPIIH